MEKIYKVTTENDCEGKTSRTLAYASGHKDDIIAYYDDQKYYDIRLEEITVTKITTQIASEKLRLLARKRELEEELNSINSNEMRNCCQIISQMIEKIPTDKTEFIKDLQWNYEDASYKAPEETLQWHRTQSTLIKHIPKPSEDWEFEVLSIFTTQSVDDIRRAVQNAL